MTQMTSVGSMTLYGTKVGLAHFNTVTVLKSLVQSWQVTVGHWVIASMTILRDRDQLIT